LLKLWWILFKRLNVSLLYIIAYHLQADRQSKCINSIVKIVLHFYLNTIIKAVKWLKSLLFIQFNLNKARNFINKMSNKTIYEFSLNIIVIFILSTVFTSNSKYVLLILSAQIKIINAIDFTNLNIKYYYDWKHQSMTVRIKNYTLLQLHCEYFILTIVNKKLRQQYVRLFWVIDKIK